MIRSVLLEPESLSVCRDALILFVDNGDTPFTAESMFTTVSSEGTESDPPFVLDVTLKLLLLL